MVTLWVVNASPVILLAKVGQPDLFQRLGPPVVIPEAAVVEIQRKGPAHSVVHELTQATWLVSVGRIVYSTAVRQHGRPGIEAASGSGGGRRERDLCRRTSGALFGFAC